MHLIDNIFLISVILFSLSLSTVGSTSYLDDVTVTSQQQKLLDQLKQRVLKELPHEYMKTDMYLLKWLRASKWDLGVAEKKILQNLKWREEQKIDKIHTEDWSDMQSKLRYSTEGKDKQGRSFLYFAIKGLDIREHVYKEREKKRLLRYTYKIMDEACTLVREWGDKYGNVTSGHLLLNADGYNLAQLGCFRCTAFAAQVMSAYQEHWPECVDKVMVVNVPSIIEPYSRALMPLARQIFQQNLKFIGTDQEKLKQELAKDFDFDQLPPELGGLEKKEVFPDPGDDSGWIREMQALVSIMNTTFSKMGSIAAKDNPKIGSKISTLLQEQVTKAAKISYDFEHRFDKVEELPTEAPEHYQIFIQPILYQIQPGVVFYYQQTAPGGHNSFAYHYRYRRQAGGGAEAFEKVAMVMTETGEKIASDKSKLSPEAQAKMDKEYVEGLKMCKSRECKSQLKTYLAGKG